MITLTGYIALASGLIALFHAFHYAVRMMNPRSTVAWNAWLGTVAFALLALLMSLILLHEEWRFWTLPACAFLLAVKGLMFAWRTHLVERMYRNPPDRVTQVEPRQTERKP